MSISWIVFKTLSPIVWPWNAQQAQQFDRMLGRILREPGGEHHEHQLDCVLKLSLLSSGLGTHSRRSSSTECLDGFREPGG